MTSYGRSGLAGIVRGRRGGVFAALGTLGRGFGRTQQIGQISRGDIDLAANERGDVAIAFVDRAGLRVVVRRAGRRFGRPLPIAGVRRARFAPTVAINARGDVLVAWNSRVRSVPRRAGSHAVFARLLAGNGRFGRVSGLDPGGCEGLAV